MNTENKNLNATVRLNIIPIVRIGMDKIESIRKFKFEKKFLNNSDKNTLGK